MGCDPLAYGFQGSKRGSCLEFDVRTRRPQFQCCAGVYPSGSFFFFESLGILSLSLMVSCSKFHELFE